MVQCPLCAASMRNSDVFAHLDVCCGGGGAESGSGGCSSADRSTSSSGSGGDTSSSGANAADSMPVGVEAAACPVCSRVFNGLAALNEHLDTECSSSSVGGGGAGGGGGGNEGVGDGGTIHDSARDAGGGTTSGSSQSAETRAERTPASSHVMDRLAAELRCSLCFDIFDDPHSLPCQHSFCRTCIISCFRVTKSMQCPLCKAPSWMRQVTPNHTLAGIVRAFKEASPELA